MISGDRSNLKTCNIGQQGPTAVPSIDDKRRSQETNNKKIAKTKKQYKKIEKQKTTHLINIQFVVARTCGLQIKFEEARIAVATNQCKNFRCGEQTVKGIITFQNDNLRICHQVQFNN